MIYIFPICAIAVVIWIALERPSQPKDRREPKMLHILEIVGTDDRLFRHTIDIEPNATSRGKVLWAACLEHYAAYLFSEDGSPLGSCHSEGYPVTGETDGNR